MSQTFKLALFALTLFTFSRAAQADRFGGGHDDLPPGRFSGRHDGRHDGDRFGRRFKWIGSRCSEFTPQGVLIRYADEWRCRRH